MLLTTPEPEAPVASVHVTGQTYRLQAFIGNPPVRGTYVEGNEANDNAEPQGFLVFQPAGAITRPHFHETNQFQVFVGGSGRFGKKPAVPLTVQYASGHTPYGPITAGDDGVVYYTLRQRWDPGAKYMPAMRDRLVRGRQRQRLVTPTDPMEGEEWLLLPEEDGLAAKRVSLTAGESVQLDSPASAGGQYHVIVNGSVTHEGTVLPERSCQFAGPGEQPVTLTAGSDGATVLMLRFPALHESP